MDKLWKCESKETHVEESKKLSIHYCQEQTKASRNGKWMKKKKKYLFNPR